ncbi:MAG TPA: pyruvate kinase [Candidatus Methylomirabilis sp.]|nr:pyruvate kinase [Candidatus Methylomirabilis sp.]
MKPQQKRTKIVCTIGPASNTDVKIRALIKAGMNVARLNFSHGTHEDHAELIRLIRTVAAELQEPVAILQDLQGPKIRVGDLPKEGVELKAGDTVVFTTGKADIGKKRLPVTYDKLHEDVKPGERILLDDGLLSAKVTKVEGRDVICEVVDGGVLTSHKGVNFPNTKLSVSAITEKDKEDVKFGVQQHVDWVALSFVRSAKEIYDLKYFIQGIQAEIDLLHHHEYPIRVIAKIEKPDAVENVDEIIVAVDGIMVARGDLGIEMPGKEVPLIQKRLIDKCREAAKPVIVATQLLDSMIRNPRPTRAEVSDVANAVIDHTDAVMLSGETASGKYPVETVQTMAQIVEETEASKYDDVPPRADVIPKTTDEAISQVANILAHGVKAKLILVGSLSGDTARLVSRYRPELPIHAAVTDERVERQLNLSWGVVPFVLPRCGTVEELVERSIGHLKKRKTVTKGDKIIVVAGDPVGASGVVNLVEIREVK